MSLGFKLYSFFNGNLVHEDSLGNKYYHDKKNIQKRWVVYASGFGPESLPTQYHNWLHNTSDEIPDFDVEQSTQVMMVKKRLQKHTVKHKGNIDKGYSSWKPK